MMRFPSFTASYAGCKLQIGYLEQRLAESDITLEVTDDALDLLDEAGFDPIYGARPLKRAIQQDLKTAWRRTSSPARSAPMMSAPPMPRTAGSYFR